MRKTLIVFLTHLAVPLIGLAWLGTGGLIAGALLSASVGGWLTWRNEREIAVLKERTRPPTPGEQLRADRVALARQTSIRLIMGGDR